MNETSDSPDEPALDLGGAPAAGAGGAYRVLARKYRPSTFDDLIGQDAMVRTLSNAFEAGRIPQAWILTGVRGIGKTTTARILARALNYELPEGGGGPSIRMPAFGVHCQAIMESRHVDVIEMDAASHNGVDDVRQINEAVRYAPADARYKVYILDEVHMLTPQAFNALLKTLEEPPPHVKFVFATTEIRKVPVTVLSRCQRFDLRRVEAGVLVGHLERICGKEGITAEPEALAVIARAAEGSVRDALSLLDQAIAHAAGSVRANDVRQMLGLADRANIIDLFEALMRGDAAAALHRLRDQYDSGADPAVVLGDLAEFTHFVTRVKVVPAVADDRSIGESERARARDFAAGLSMRVLARTWQMLLKGFSEVQSAGKPIAAAEMVLVRIAYAADLPTPDDVIRMLGNGGTPAPAQGTGTAKSAAVAVAEPAGGARIDAAPSRPAHAPTRAFAATKGPAATARAVPAAAPAEPPPGAAARAVSRFEDLLALAAQMRDLPIQRALEAEVRLVRFEDGRLEVALEPGAPETLTGELARKLSEWTGRRWLVIVSSETAAPTLKTQAAAQRAELMRGVRGDPLVQAVLTRFPGAEIVGVRRRNGEFSAPADEAIASDGSRGDSNPDDAPFASASPDSNDDA